MVYCTSCNCEIEQGDQFCGECGTKVETPPVLPSQSVEQKTAPQANQDSSPQQSEPKAAQDTNRSQKRSMIFGAGTVIAVLLVIGLASMFASEPQYAPIKVTAPTPKAPPKGVQQAHSKVIPAAPTKTSQGDTIQNYIQRVRAHYQSQGINLEAPYQIDVESCSGCVPFLFYCSFPIQNVAELKGKKVRVFSEESEQMIKRAGGSPQRIAFSEVHAALRLNIIQCSVSGGGAPS